MTALLIGYARCSTDQQDLTAQRDGLTALGVAPARMYVDHGLTGTNRDRPGLREALAACGEGDTLVVTKESAQRRRRPCLVETPSHPAVPEQVHVLNALRAGDDSRDQRGDLTSAYAAPTG